MDRMQTPLYQVDAFAAATFGGNPAAVCPLERWLEDDVMQLIAAENNLSETAFFVGGEGHYGLRWFTPRAEVDLCGHATLASGHVVLAHLEPERDEVRFETRSGTLTVQRAPKPAAGSAVDRYALDLPRRMPRRHELAPEYLAAVGVRPREVLDGGCPILVLATEAEVRSARPDMTRLAALEPHGVVVTAPADEPGVDFVSRFFAPALGIPEDPVTGSIHGALAPLWAERLGVHTLEARQVSERGGALTCEVEDRSVRLFGGVAPYLRGTIEF